MKGMLFNIPNDSNRVAAVSDSSNNNNYEIINNSKYLNGQYFLDTKFEENSLQENVWIFLGIVVGLTLVFRCLHFFLFF